MKAPPTRVKSRTVPESSACTKVGSVLPRAPSCSRLRSGTSGGAGTVPLLWNTCGVFGTLRILPHGFLCTVQWRSVSIQMQPECVKHCINNNALILRQNCCHLRNCKAPGGKFTMTRKEHHIRLSGRVALRRIPLNTFRGEYATPRPPIILLLRDAQWKRTLVLTGFCMWKRYKYGPKHEDMTMKPSIKSNECSLVWETVD